MTAMSGTKRAIALHVGVLVVLFLMQFVLSDFNQLTLTRVMVIAVFAIGYNMLFGYTGLLSLGHALFFAVGMYGAGMTVFYAKLGLPLGLLIGIGCGLVVSAVIGFVSLRTRGVSFMITTLMFAQVGYLLIFHFTKYTRGDAGLTLPAKQRTFDVFGYTLDLSNADVRFNFALAFLAVVIAIVFAVVKLPSGRVLVAIRENEERTRMLGYDPFTAKMKAFMFSGGLCGAAGAVFAILFAYIGASFASVQSSIEALLYTLLGGAGTILGPLLGTTFMVFVTDKLSEFTTAYLLVVGLILIVLILWFPKGILGTIRERWLPWIP